MKARSRFALLIAAWMFTAVLVGLNAFGGPYGIDAYAEPSGGGTAAVAVADAVHAAGKVAALSEAYGEVMGQAAAETDSDARGALLERAKNILDALVQLADNVESKITILTQKKLDRAYLRKLDRMLSKVRQWRQAAKEQMQAATGPG